MSAKQSLLEQIYYCDFLPSESATPRDPNYWPTCQKIEEETKYLSEHLNDEGKEHLDRLVNLFFDTGCMTDFANFVYGFRTGALLMHEITTP